MQRYVRTHATLCTDATLHEYALWGYNNAFNREEIYLFEYRDIYGYTICNVNSARKVFEMESKKDATPSKKRVLLTLPVELVDYLTEVTEQTGMNKSGYIGVLLRNQMLHEREDRAGDEEK